MYKSHTDYTDETDSHRLVNFITQGKFYNLSIFKRIKLKDMNLS